MELSRRLALKQMLLIAGGVTLLPSCFREDGKSLAYKNLDLGEADEKLLAEISETLIPATDTPGAKDLSLSLFTLKMVDDCYDNKEQEKFVKGLKGINAFSKKRFDNSFIDCTVPQREEILTSIENKKDVPEDVAAFYAAAKGLIIQGYMTSKYVMTKLVSYELIPGRFHGSYPVEQKSLKV